MMKKRIEAALVAHKAERSPNGIRPEACYRCWFFKKHVVKQVVLTSLKSDGLKEISIVAVRSGLRRFFLLKGVSVQKSKEENRPVLWRLRNGFGFRDRLRNLQREALVHNASGRQLCTRDLGKGLCLLIHTQISFVYDHRWL